MSNVVPLRGPRQTEDERMRFCLARRAMFNAFREWLTTRPHGDDVQYEIDDMNSALRQLRDLGV